MYGSRKEDQAMANEAGSSGGPDHFFPAGQRFFADSYDVSPKPNWRR